ncbi:hypothetical protein BH11MYX1_BH11MYX1_40000 [soil metagenome]
MRAIVLLLLAASTAYAGNVVANPPVTFITSTTGTASASASLQNTSGGGFNVQLVRDASCDPEVDFSITGANPFSLPATSSKTVTLSCTAAKLGIERCLVHAIDANTLAPLADLLAACERTSSTTLVPATTSLDFGSVVVGESASLPLSIKNNGTTPITKQFFQTDSLDDDFEIALPCNPDAPACDGTMAALAPGAAKQAIIRCAPHSVGPHTAHLEIASDQGQHVATRIAWTCTGIASPTPVLGIEPPVVDIATPAEVLGGAVHTTAYISNLGAGTLSITDLRPVDTDPGAAIDWSFSLGGTCTSVPCSISTGEQVAIDLAFDPSVVARRHASLLISFHDTIDRTRSVPLYGVGAGATFQLFATPTMLDMGSVPVGKSTSATLQFSNAGNRSTNAAVALSPAGPFSLVPAPVLAVTPTAVAELTAICTPTTAGMASTSLTAATTDTLTATSLAIATTCLATTTPLYTSPSSLSFGEVRLDGAPVTKTLMLQSNSSPLVIAGLPHLESANANFTIAAPTMTSTPASVDVTITPQSEGDLKTHVVVEDSAGDSLLVPITGRIVTASYNVPTTLDVGTFCVGQPTAPANVALTSDGTATIAVSAPTTPITSGFDLGFTSPTVYPARLAPARAATISVTPQRQNLATTLTTTVTWPTDVASNPTASTVIVARFINTGGAIAPPILDFGNEPVHLYTDDGQRVSIQNCNGSQLELDPPTIKAPFSIDSPNFPTTLEPNETATFSVGFHPTRVGDYTDTLTVSSPQLTGAPLQVSIIGHGVTQTLPSMDAGSASERPGSRTFYACSCNSRAPDRAGLAGGLPLLSACALVIFRRRRSGGSS